jgi:UDP-N-acetylmuramoyl-L-alanyl-D-glutamate--2,6-diaminopimelate ligase
MFMQKRLSALLGNCNITLTEGKSDALIEGIAYDSRSVKNNYAFFALTGIHTDGHNFIDDAVKRGASALFVSKIPENINESVSWILVDDVRKAMAFFSSAWYGNPAEKLKIIGVTGTDGKSTTVSFIYQLLNLLGRKAGFISTVEYDCSGKPEKNPFRQSTPESPEIMDILSKMVQNNFEYGIIESTSHGLSDKTFRLAAIEYDASVLTNVTHEHLEFHGTMENYINDKANLFRKTTGFCVVNYSEPAKMHFINAASSPVISYSLDDNNSDIYASNITSDSSGTLFSANYRGKTYRCNLPIPGIFNVENFLAASLAVSRVTGENMEKVLLLSRDLESVNGRMATVKLGQDFTVIVDYAHTPGAFEKIFPMIKQTVKGRLIALFGSAGERDTEKRAIQ